jgi:hypothetical protein
MNWKVLAVGAALIASPVFAQVQVGVGVQVSVPLPTIQFEVAPPLVVVSPGVQVVRDYREEVFFVDGWYWCRRDSYWFRTRDYRGGWVVVERPYVPATLVKIPPGHYKHYRGRGAPPPGAAVYGRPAPPPGAVYVPVERQRSYKHKKFKNKKFKGRR